MKKFHIIYEHKIEISARDMKSAEKKAKKIVPKNATIKAISGLPV